MTSRRQFLGAAAALAALAAPDADDASRSDVGANDWGISRAKIEAGPPVWGSISLPEFHDDESTIRVSGYHYDDEPGQVEIQAAIGGAPLTLNCSAERARELAGELVAAAAHADGEGDR